MNMPNQRTSAKDLLNYGLLGWALGAVAVPIYIQVPYLYSRIYEVPSAWVGIILLISRLLDAVLDPATRCLTYSNAGHGLGFIRRSHGAVESFGAQGLPMGIWAGVEYTEASTSLAPGDLVVVYSDGLLDARGEPPLTVEEMVAVLDTPLDAAAVVARLVELAAPAGELPDDLTVMALRSLA